jgi:hypothetical protein
MTSTVKSSKSNADNKNLVGVTEAFLNSGVNIYPNPSNGLTFFEVILKQSGNVSLEIFNPLGQKVYSSENYLSSGKHILNSDISKFPSGLYFYTIRCGSSTVNGKIVLE